MHNPLPFVVLAATLLTAPAHADATLEEGRALFTAGAVPACGVCHSLADAGSEGVIGPNLDDIAPDEARVRNAVAGGIGVMPAYGDTLGSAEIDALALYVSTAVSQ